MEQSPWAAYVGDLLTEDEVLRALIIDAVALENAVRWRQVLRLITESGHQVYPAWQIRDGAVIAGLQPVLETLHTGTEDAWSWALWLSSVVHERDGGNGVRRQVDELIGGRLAVVLGRAEVVAEAWTH